MASNLEPLPIAVNRNLVSYNGGASTYVNFINCLTVDAKVCWIDGTGKRVFYATVKPGQTHRQQTYVGHPWEVTTETGFKANYLPIAAESNVVLESKNVTNLTPLPAEVTEDLRSIEGQSATVVNFINHLDVDAKVYWIDYNGNRVLYATLKPGEVKRQETYVGHPWEVVAAPNIKDIYAPLEIESNVILERDYSLKNGKVYNIINAQTNTYLDLSGTDGVSIIGYVGHGGENQKWILQSVNGCWTLKNKYRSTYLGIGPAGIKPSTPLNAVANAVQWDIRAEGTGGFYRLFVPGNTTPLNVDLTGSNAGNGTPVILYQKTQGYKNQIWKFVAV